MFPVDSSPNSLFAHKGITSLPPHRSHYQANQPILTTISTLSSHLLTTYGYFATPTPHFLFARLFLCNARRSTTQRLLLTQSIPVCSSLFSWKRNNEHFFTSWSFSFFIYLKKKICGIWPFSFNCKRKNKNSKTLFASLIQTAPILRPHFCILCHLTHLLLLLTKCSTVRKTQST